METNCEILLKTVILQLVILHSLGFKRIITDKNAAEVRLTVYEPKQEHRGKRSANELPDDIAFELPLESTSLSVFLRRNDHISHHVPITVERSGKIINHNVNDKQDIGYYFDITNGSSLMVQYSAQKENENKLEFFGTIFHDSQAYLLQPPDDMHDTHSLLKIEGTQTMEDVIAEKIPVRHAQPKIRHYKHKDGRHKRHKRRLYANSDQHKVYEIELLIVADFSVYSFWKEQEPVWSTIQEDINAKINIRQYYALLLNAIDLRFKSVTGRGYEIRVLFAGLHIADTVSSSSWTEPSQNYYYYLPTSVDPYDALDHFETWLNNNSTVGLPGHDHAMLFTRYKLENIFSDTILGVVGEIGGLCGAERVSIVKDDVRGQEATVAAHELGHSLNAHHDGYLNNCASDKYIMASPLTVSINITVNKGLWQFSRCSLDYFHEFIEDLNSNDSNCMAARSASYNASALSEYSNDLLGQMYPPDRQCEIATGTSSYMSRERLYFDYSRICSLMHCSGEKDAQIPWEGTTCGNGKICERGSCVFSPLAPTDLRETCLFGDFPGYLRDYKTCYDILITEALHYECYSYERWCCETCEKIAVIYKHIAGCTYGDRSPYCAPSRCASSSSHYRSYVCCSTCNLAESATLSATSVLSISTAASSTKPSVLSKTPPAVTEMTSSASTSTPSSIIIERLPVAPLIEGPVNQTAVLGEDVVFECTILFNDSQSLLQWLKHYKINGSYVNDKGEPYIDILQQSGWEKTVDNPERLILPNVTEKDEGWYTCLVANTIGTNYRSAWLAVVNDSCLVEDKHEYITENETCQDILTTDDLHYKCYSYEQQCCWTCGTIANKYKDISECQYGDRSPLCDVTRCVSSGTTYSTYICCSTCKLAASTTLSTTGVVVTDNAESTTKTIMKSSVLSKLSYAVSRQTTASTTTPSVLSKASSTLPKRLPTPARTPFAFTKRPSAVYETSSTLSMTSSASPARVTTNQLIVSGIFGLTIWTSSFVI